MTCWSCGGFEKSRFERKTKEKGSLILDALGALLAAAAGRLLGQENGLDVGENASLGDGDSLEQLVQLLVVPDGELEVARVDPLFLVVAGGVAGQLEDLSGEVLHDGCQVYGSSCSDSLGVVALTEETVDSADWELKTGTGRPALGLGTGFSSFATSRHDDDS